MTIPGRPSWLRPEALSSLYTLPIAVLVVVAAGFVIRPSPVWAALVYAVLLPTALMTLWRERRLDPATHALLPGLLLIAWMSLSVAWGVNLGARSAGSWLLRGFATFLFVTSLATVVANSERDHRRLINLILIFATINALWSIGRYVYIGGLETSARLQGWAETRHSILGASIIGMALVLAVGRLLEERRRWPLLAICVLASVAFIVLTGSRGPLLATLVALLAFLPLVPRRQLLLWAAGLAAAGMVVCLGWWELVQAAADALTKRGMSYRLDIWKVAIEQIAQNPWFGYGPEANLPLREGHRFPHNILLSTWFYCGVIGVAFLVAQAAMMVRRLWPAAVSVRRQTAVALALQLFVAGITDVAQLIKGPGPLWYIVWIPVVLVMTMRLTSSAEDAPGR